MYIETGGKIKQLDGETGDVVRDFCPVRHRASGIVVGGGYLLTATCPTM